MKKIFTEIPDLIGNTRLDVTLAEYHNRTVYNDSSVFIPEEEHKNNLRTLAQKGLVKKTKEGYIFTQKAKNLIKSNLK